MNNAQDRKGVYSPQTLKHWMSQINKGAGLEAVGSAVGHKVGSTSLLIRISSLMSSLTFATIAATAFPSALL